MHACGTCSAQAFLFPQQYDVSLLCHHAVRRALLMALSSCEPPPLQLAALALAALSPPSAMEELDMAFAATAQRLAAMGLTSHAAWAATGAPSAPTSLALTSLPQAAVNASARLLLKTTGMLQLLERGAVGGAGGAAAAASAGQDAAAAAQREQAAEQGDAPLRRADGAVAAEAAAGPRGPAAPRPQAAGGRSTPPPSAAAAPMATSPVPPSPTQARRHLGLGGASHAPLAAPPIFLNGRPHAAATAAAGAAAPHPSSLPHSPVMLFGGQATAVSVKKQPAASANGSRPASQLVCLTTSPRQPKGAPLPPNALIAWAPAPPGGSGSTPPPPMPAGSVSAAAALPAPEAVVPVAAADGAASGESTSTGGGASPASEGRAGKEEALLPPRGGEAAAQAKELDGEAAGPR